MRQGKKLSDIIVELQRQQRCKRDYVVVPQALRFDSDASGMHLSIENDAAAQGFFITKLARRQLADRLGIPFDYFERMGLKKPDLLDRNVNTWLQHPETDTAMVRTLDGSVRAFLSAKYRRLDNFQLATAVLPALEALPNYEIASIDLTETNFYIKAVVPGIVAEVTLGDIVQAGVSVSNSEVGRGALTISPFVLRLVCSNGLAMVDEAFSRHHVGKVQLASGSSALFRDDTIDAEDKSFFLKVRDTVADAVSLTKLQISVDRMRKLSGYRIQGDALAAVKQLSNDLSLTVEEHAGVLMSFVENHDVTAFGLLNAVTDYSKRVASYDRATELETFGGKMLTWSPEIWNRIVSARHDATAITREGRAPLRTERSSFATSV